MMLALHLYINFILFVLALASMKVSAYCYKQAQGKYGFNWQKFLLSSEVLFHAAMVFSYASLGALVFNVALAMLGVFKN